MGLSPRQPGSYRSVAPDRQAGAYGRRSDSGSATGRHPNRADRRAVGSPRGRHRRERKPGGGSDSSLLGHGGADDRARVTAASYSAGPPAVSLYSSGEVASILSGSAPEVSMRARVA